MTRKKWGFFCWVFRPNYKLQMSASLKGDETVSITNSTKDIISLFLKTVSIKWVVFNYNVYEQKNTRLSVA